MRKVWFVALVACVAPRAALHGPVVIDGNTIAVDALHCAVPADFAIAGARIVDVGTETIVAVASPIEEDDLAWRILVLRNGALHDFGTAYLGNQPTLPGDGTIRVENGNCGQTVDTVYRVTATKLEITEHTTGAYDANACAG